jgi:uncharacterized protein (TIGR03663 family)
MSKNLANHKEKRHWLFAGLLFTVIAAFLRLYLLDNKPIHFDESINMWFVQQIWDNGFFNYDPTNYHGPLLFYLIQLAQIFTGFDFISTRLVAGIFSALTVIVLWWAPCKERGALRWASAFLLLSPAMGFYGRSGIHESAFVFFQILGFLSFHFFAAKEFKKFWWAFAAGLLGMMALKETFVVLILAWVPAAVLVAFLNRKKGGFSEIKRQLWQSLNAKDVVLPLTLMLALFVGLYTGFGCHPQGLADFFVALMPWLKTGVQGNGHEKPFLHWTDVMAKYEFVILAAQLLALPFAKKNKWILFYGVFALGNWLIYSLIPYKTPWCLISILWPFAVVAGFAMEDLHKPNVKAWVRNLLFTVLTVLTLWQSKTFYDIQFKNPIDMDHPYVYVNSTYPMKDFISGVQEILAANPLLREKPIQIATEESWPLPIVFAKSFSLNYKKMDAELSPETIIYFVDEKDESVMDGKLKAQGQTAGYAKYLLSVRQGRGPIFVYLQNDFASKRPHWDMEMKGAL